MRNATLTKSHGLFFEGGGEEGVGKGIQIYDVCVFVTQPSFVFSSNIFFGGRGGGRWGPFLSDPFSYIIFIEISFDLFQKKAPPQAELYLL